MKFPLPFVPTTTYKGGNGFGANRDNVRKGLMHAANDLAAPKGTPVLAMDSGTVIRLTPFFRGTFALEVQHPRFIGRYCEIDRHVEVRAGDIVKEGQVIAYVGDQPGDDMLHMEFFLGNLSGDLSFAPGAHPPYDRRDDVFNGVKFLDWSVNTVLYKGSANKYEYETGNDGRKFLVKRPVGDFPVGRRGSNIG